MLKYMDHIMDFAFFVFLSSMLVCWISLFLLLIRFIPSTFYYKNFRDNKEVRVLIKQAAKFYCKELGVNPKKIKIKTIWPSQLFNTVNGFVVNKNDKYNIYLYMNHNKYNILETLAHEIIHAHQYERGDLRDHGINIIWKNKDYTQVPYYNRPWEIEAFTNEKPLAKKFFIQNNMKKPKTISIADKILSIL